MTRWLVIMVKEPRPGQVKTRLARDIGSIRAAWWYRHQSAKTIQRLRDPRWNSVIAVSPDHAGWQSRVWPSDLDRLGQGRGDLGQRMENLLRFFGGDPTLVIGSDIPGVRPYHIARAFRALAANDAVLGPAKDGGFWAIGIKGSAARKRRMFEGVEWSSPRTLSDTVRALGIEKLGLVDELADVDEVGDL